MLLRNTPIFRLTTLVLWSIVAIMCSSLFATDDSKVVYVLFNNHIEGQPGSPVGSPTCPDDIAYQVLPPPAIGNIQYPPSFAVDLLGTKWLHDRTDLLTDSYGGKPKWFECPVGEFWQTEVNPQYGGKLFTLLDFFQTGDEFGVQGHAIYFSNLNYCWYETPHTAEGIGWKFRDMDHFAELAYHDGRKINQGQTFTGGHKLESPALGAEAAERVIDSVAFALGYRISYEDHGGHLEDEPAGVGNSRPCYYLYRAEYANGAKIWKIDINGSIQRFDSTVAARLADSSPSHLYYFAGVVHASAYFAGKHAEVSGLPPLPGEWEYSEFNRFIDSLQVRIQAGVKVKFVTPSELVFLAGPKVYLTLVSHNEEPGLQQPDYLLDKPFYYNNREFVRQLALIVKSKGAMWNFQSDWNFLKAVAVYDTGAAVANTNGKNIVRWLVEDMGFEADPHAHETQYNYADVAYLHTVLGVTPSGNVGGFLYDPPDNSQGWEQHEQGTFGVMYPTYFWKPANLWGAATYLHLGNDDCSFGMWKPKDKYHFYEHDSTKDLAYIGGGGDYVGVKLLAQAIDNQTVPDSGFYTAKIFIPQGELGLMYVQHISDVIDSMNILVGEGKVVWSSLTQTANRWRNLYGSRPFRLSCDAVTLPQICGDANADGIIDISDVVYLLAFIFSGGPAPNPPAAGDANGDGAVDISDVVYLIAYIFSGGPAPGTGCK